MKEKRRGKELVKRFKDKVIPAGSVRRGLVTSTAVLALVGSCQTTQIPEVSTPPEVLLDNGGCQKTPEQVVRVAPEVSLEAISCGNQEAVVSVQNDANENPTKTLNDPLIIFFPRAGKHNGQLPGTETVIDFKIVNGHLTTASRKPLTTV
ncbi:MAG TPA: hypothetical protein VNW29_02830 [Candidatus Sulfotelmatobacter sp.]|nr:hypothetical protein [Candidatus Sulfotelmatobacter sp.]